METDCCPRTSHLERPEEDGDYLEWARLCRNRKRTDLNSSRKCQWNIWWCKGKWTCERIYTIVDLNASFRWLDRNHLLQHFLKDALFKDCKFIARQIDPSHCEISYYRNQWNTNYSVFLDQRKDLLLAQKSIYLRMSHFRWSSIHC